MKVDITSMNYPYSSDGADEVYDLALSAYVAFSMEQPEAYWIGGFSFGLWTNGTILTHDAFSKIPVVGQPILTFGLITFAFSTILGWCYYGERAVEYLKGHQWVIAYRIAYIAAVFIGSIMSLQMVWNFADCMNALMAIPNLISILALSGILVHETRKYLWRNRLDEEMND